MNRFIAQFELSRDTGAGNIRPMEGLRGFAVFLVFLVHYVTLVAPWIPQNSWLHIFSHALHSVGNVGVDLFFVLSGFLIYGSVLSRPQDFREFMLKRIRRIYPAFTAVFTVYLALSFLFPVENKIPPSLFEGAVYLAQNFFLLPGLFPIKPMITVAWSLSYEMFYYIVMPILAAIVGLRNRSVRWRVWFFILVALIIMVCCIATDGPVRLVMFVAGILLYEAVHNLTIKSPGGAFAVSFFFGAMLFLLLLNEGAIGNALKFSFLFLALLILCFVCFSRESSWLQQAFSWAPLRWLGNMSYSYYLIHGLALKLGFLVLAIFFPAKADQAYLFFGMLPIMFGLTLISASVLFLVVERPFLLAPQWPRARLENC